MEKKENIEEKQNETEEVKEQLQETGDTVSRKSLMSKINALLPEFADADATTAVLALRKLVEVEPAVEEETCASKKCDIPCKVDDVVWIVTTSVAQPVKAEIFEVEPYGRVTTNGKIYNIGMKTVETKELLYARFRDFGKTVFNSPLDAAKSIVRPINSCVKGDLTRDCFGRGDVKEILCKVGVIYKTDDELIAFLCGLFGYNIENKYERTAYDNLSCLLRVITNRD